MKIKNMNIIKIQMIKKGYSQKEIAEKIEISEGTLSRWANGKIGNIEKFIKLCNLLELEIKNFIE